MLSVIPPSSGQSLTTAVLLDKAIKYKLEISTCKDVVGFMLETNSAESFESRLKRKEDSTLLSN